MALSYLITVLFTEIKTMFVITEAKAEEFTAKSHIMMRLRNGKSQVTVTVFEMLASVSCLQILWNKTGLNNNLV